MQLIVGMLIVLGGLLIVYEIIDRCLLTIERCSKYKWASRATKRNKQNRKEEKKVCGPINPDDVDW